MNALAAISVCVGMFATYTVTKIIDHIKNKKDDNN